MSRVCYVTGKKPVSGNKRSHSVRTTKRRFDANLQKVRIMVDGKPKKVYVSARELKNVERV